jgi:hypothetical protein
MLSPLRDLDKGAGELSFFFLLKSYPDPSSREVSFNPCICSVLLSVLAEYNSCYAYLRAS